ncbi:MAG: T9SS type A sorting domain-containing protein [Saprospirales bacterium]|nr:T9SS type A sorting domain-containing protein [Saprospirales bacterium]
MTRILLFFGVALFTSLSLQAQAPAVKHSVMLSAVVQESPARITLQWLNDDVNATGYNVNRRTPGSGAWGSPLATLPAGTTIYEDNDVMVGTSYEYRVTKIAAAYTGYGYLTAGIKIPETEQRGVVLLVIDSSKVDVLATEIDRLEADLEGDGWIVKRIEASPDASPVAVKAQILAKYNEAPSLSHSIFLLGHVPVPYSGEINPDGHPDHLGAWPADGYYADVDGVWTDLTVNNTVANDARNDNVPGDGKFDQSLFPSPLEMESGRVDFAKLPAFALSETELLRRYLNKNHAFRHGEIETVRRGLIEDNFGSFEEGFSQSGRRSFSAFFGADSVFLLDFQSTLQSKSYLWSYGCGGGSYTSCGGITNTSNYTTDSLRTVFTMLFGSYFGDWDSNNNLMRASLASGQTLSNAWAGRPNWVFHHMGLGSTLGYCAQLTQFNPSNYYSPGYGNRFVHIALMGDPTLRMHIVVPPANFTAVEDNGHALLTWDPSPDATQGYHLYRKTEGEESYQRLNDSPISGTSYVDSCLHFNTTYEYMVRARNLESSASGSYFNLSQGLQASLLIATDLAVGAGFDPVINGDELTLTNTSQNASGYLWDFGDGNTSEEEAPTHIYQVIGDYELVLIASNACYSDTSTQSITITIAITEETSGTGWRVFPNPTNGWLSIELPDFNGLIFVEVFDLQGRLLFKQSVAANQRVNLSTLPAGVYWLRAEAGEEKWVGKIIKK